MTNIRSHRSQTSLRTAQGAHHYRVSVGIFLGKPSALYISYEPSHNVILQKVNLTTRSGTCMGGYYSASNKVSESIRIPRTATETDVLLKTSWGKAELVL